MTTLSVNGATPFTIVSNTWDTYGALTAPDGTVVLGGYTGSGSPPTKEYDSTAGSLGKLTMSVAYGRGTGTNYYPWGMVSQVNSDDGTTSTASADASTNYAAPVTITAQSYNTTVGYTPFLGVAQTTGSNGEQLSMTYDTYGRPTSGYSPYWTKGPQRDVLLPLPRDVRLPHATITPAWQREDRSRCGMTTTTVDGFGHTIRVARGD